jgi:hypothetical protein
MLVIVFLLLASPVLAQDGPSKLCIVAAAEQLPKVPGIAIVASRTKSERPEGGVPMMSVELDVKIAAIDATYSFLCGTPQGRPVRAKMLGLIR